jgi:hypothetical protein
MRPFKRTRGLIIVGALAMLGAGGSWALAAGGGAIHACAGKRTGALRLAKKCKHSERAVSWQVQGPQGRPGSKGQAGARGIQGKTGTPGTQGPPGATRGLNDFNDGPVNLVANFADQTVATMPNVPAGSYIITAKLVYGAIDAVSFNCKLAAGGDFDRSESDIPSPKHTTTVAFTLSHTFSAPGSVTLSCQGVGKLAQVTQAKISAIQVQTLIRTSG